MEKQKIGQLKKIENKNKKINENDYYHLVYLEKEGYVSGFLFTESQLYAAKERFVKNPEDQGKVKKGFLKTIKCFFLNLFCFKKNK